MPKGKKIRKGYFIYFIWIAFFVICLLGKIISRFENNTNDVVAADGFTIEGYNIVLDVKEDNKIFVKENITVDWNEIYHHGILKYIPQWLKYTGKDGKTIKRKSTITNLAAVGEPYATDWVKKKARIKIGNANEYVHFGEKEYTISYVYDMGADPFKNFDEFIFHGFGDYWGTEINNATIQVNMPKSIEGCKINFYTDKYRENNVTNFVNYEIIGNSIYAKFDSENYKPLVGSLTIDIELPEDYFVGGSWNYGWGSFTIIVTIIVLTILTAFRWKKYGKDFTKRSETVEFYPPENYSAAEVGYIYNKNSTKRSLISLIIQLASKGYIKIDELKDKSENIQITNLYHNPMKFQDFQGAISKRIIIVKKIKEADSNLSKAAKTMMSYMFKEGEIKELISNIEHFLKIKNELIKGGYIEIIADNENDFNDNAAILKKQHEQKEVERNKELEEYNEKILKLKPLSEYEQKVYDELFITSDIVILSLHKTIYKCFDKIDLLLKSKLKDKIIDSKATKKMGITIISAIIVFILSFIAYSFIEDMNPSWNILYVISFVCIFVNLFFAIIMKRKTDYGEEIIAKVKGFRDFLIKVEKPKLEELVSQNPKYFYDILPYTYALNVSKTWVKKFENISMPEMNIGNIDFNSDSSLYSIYDNVYRCESVNGDSGSSSSGCSSCGGGCSSCGGGCSSCGGGGSW